MENKVKQTETTLAERIENFWHQHDRSPDCRICTVMNEAADALRRKDAEIVRLGAEVEALQTSTSQYEAQRSAAAAQRDALLEQIETALVSLESSLPMQVRIDGAILVLK